MKKVIFTFNLLIIFSYQSYSQILYAPGGVNPSGTAGIVEIKGALQLSGNNAGSNILIFSNTDPSYYSNGHRFEIYPQGDGTTGGLAIYDRTAHRTPLFIGANGNVVLNGNLFFSNVNGGLQSPDPNGISFYSNELNVKSGNLYIGYRTTSNTIIQANGGNVGIGTLNPVARLHLTQNSGSWNEGIYLTLGNYNWNIVSDVDGQRLLISRNQNEASGISIYNGSVGINKGLPNTNYKLDVAGKIRADEIVINTSGADFVFSPTYKLPTLSEVEQFVKTNQHLPEIPSATEMQQQGVSVSEMQVKLLQKVEELTLYMIEQQKTIEQLKKENIEIRNLLK